MHGSRNQFKIASAADCAATDGEENGRDVSAHSAGRIDSRRSAAGAPARENRSEERRVGKECRSRGWGGTQEKERRGEDGEGWSQKHGRGGYGAAHSGE